MKVWCTAAFLDPTLLVETGRACEAAGFHGMMLADHLVAPETVASRYPYASDGAPPEGLAADWPDPWVAIGAVAAATRTLWFSTNVCIAPARHPLALAKSVATASVVSRGRVALGVGVGWMREEYEAVDQEFSTRGRRLDEMLDMLRALWTGDAVEHDGRHYRHERLTLRPVPPAPIPIYVGGESDAALRRAASADGWIGSLYADGDLEGHLARLAAARQAAGATGDHEVIVTLPRAIYDLERYRRLRDQGVTGVMCAPWMSARDVGGPSMTKVRERLQRYADQVITRL